MFRGLFLILVLACWVRGEERMQGTLRITKNQDDPATKDKVMTVTAAINSAQYNNIVHQNIQVIVPTPSHGCSSLVIPEDFGGFSSTSMPIYFLIDGSTGDCSYGKKVDYARKGLAKGAIIVDSPQGINNLRRSKEKDQFVTLLISESEGQSLLKKSVSFIGQLSMSDRSKTRKNEMEIWVSSLNADSYKILHEWKDVLSEVSVLDSRVSWSPRFAFYECSGEACSRSDYVSSCACGGEFCSPEQHGSTSNVLVREDIRQRLIFNSHPDKFLEYTKKFFKQCFDAYSKTMYAEDCATGLMHELELDASINSKIDNFLTECADSNFKLYQSLALDRAKYGQIGHYPTVLLNHEQLEFRNKDEFKNSVCRKLGLEQESGCGTVSESTTIFSTIVSGFFYFLLISLLLGAGGFVVLFFRNKLRRDMNKELKMQVSTAVEHYFTLSEAHH